MDPKDAEVYRRLGELQRENAALRAKLEVQEDRIADLKEQLERADVLAHETLAVLDRQLTGGKGKKRCGSKGQTH